MPRDLSPQELDFYNQRSRTENILEQPEPVMGRSNLFGSAVDSLQGQLYGLAEAAGLRSARDLRLANEAEASRVSNAYYRQTGNPRTMGDISSAGDLGSYVLDKAVESTPTMGAIVGASLLNPAAAFGMSSLLGTADVVDNQRQAGGRTNLAAALPLGLAYGASDMLLGSTAALARRGLGTGVRALDDLGTSALANIPGKTGAATRFGVNLLKTGAAEAADETFQEVMNRAGRTAVSNEKIFDNDALDSYGESAFAGGLLGGAFGLPGAVGAARGRKAPTLDSSVTAPVASVDNPAQPTNLLNTQQVRPGGLLPTGPMAQGSLFNSGDEGTVSWLPESSAPLPPLSSLLEQRQTLRGQLDTLQGMYDAAEQEFKATGDAATWGQKRNRLMGMLGQLSPIADNLEAQIEQATRNEAGSYGRQGALDFAAVPTTPRPEFDLTSYGQSEGPLAGVGADNQPQLGIRQPMPGQRSLMSGVFDFVGGQPVELTSDELQAGGLYGNRQNNLLTQMSPIQGRIDQNMGIGQPGAPKNYPQQFRAAASEPTNLWAIDPATGHEVRLDAGQASAIHAGDDVQLTPEVIRAQEVGVAAAQEKKAIEGRKERTAAAGLDPKKVQHVQAWSYIEEALDNGVIDQAEAARLAANVATGVDKVGGIQKYLTGLAATKQALKDGDAQAKQSAIDKVQQKASNGTPTTQAQQAAPQGSQAPAAGAPAAAVSNQAPVVSEKAAVTSQGANAVSGEAPVVAGTVKERVQQRLNAWAEQFPQMPRYDLLSNRELARLEDLENRGELNLAAAQTVLGANQAPASKADAKASAKTKVMEDGTVVTELPFVDPKAGKAQKDVVETEQGAEFRKNFLDYYGQMEPQAQDIMREWIGFDLDVNGEMVMRDTASSQATIGAQLVDRKTGKLGITKQAVSKQIRQAVKDLGFSVTGADRVSPQKLRENVVMALAGTDLETINRNLDFATTDQTDTDEFGSEVGFGQPNELDGESAAVQEALELGQISEKQAERAKADIEAKNEKPESEEGDLNAEGMEFAKDSDEDVGAAEDSYETDFDAARQREEESGILMEYLKDELADGRVLESDIEEARYIFDKLLGKGAGAFNAVSISTQAAAVRQYATVRARGTDPVVKKAQEGVSNVKRTEPATSNREAVPSGTVQVREDRVQDGDVSAGSSGQAGQEVPQAGNQTQDVGTRAKAKLKAAGQNVAKADLSDEELTWAIQTYEKLGNEAKVAEAKKVAESRQAAAPVAETEERPATPFTQEATTEPTDSSFGSTTQIERNLRAKSHDKENPGDVMLNTTGKFVSLEDAVAAAREAMTPAQWKMPFQFNRMLDIAGRDWDRMVKAMADEPTAPFSKPQFSKGDKATKGSDAKTLAAELRAFMRVGTLGNRVVVVQSTKDIPAGVRRSVGVSNNTQGFVFGGKAYLIADQIAAGDARAVFLHEVGAHLGMEEILGAHYDKLVDKITEWAGRNDGSLEHMLAVNALKRVFDAGTNDEQRNSELVAYFIEEAVNSGIEPSALKHGPLRKFLQEVFNAFKAVLAKFGLNSDKVTAQDFVDLAYGAARVEMKEVDSENSSRSVANSIAAKANSKLLAWARDIESRKSRSPDAVATVSPVSPTVLRMLGFHRPITINVEHVRHIFNTHPEITPEDIAALPDLLTRPRAVMTNEHSGGGLRVIVDARTPNGEPLQVVLKHTTEGVGKGALRVTGVSTLYGLSESASKVAQAAWNNELLYLPKREIARLQELQSMAPIAIKEGGPSTTHRGGDLKTIVLSDEALASFTKNPKGDWETLTVPMSANPNAPKALKGVQFSIAKKAEDQARKVAGETGAKIAVDTTNLASKALGALTYLHDIVESAKAKLPSAEKWYKATMDIQAARNRMNQEAERIVKMFTESGIRADKVNKMLFDATFEQKWPYDTERLDRKTGQMVTIKADPELANRFDNELTAKERAIVKAVFAHGEKMLDHKYAVLKKLGLTGTFKAETGKLQGPYAPLKRFGNYISVLKSADLVAAEDAGDEKLTEKLKADPEHYEVRFHDTKGQASEYARANAKAGGQAYHFEKSERVGGALPMNSRVLSNIRAALKMDDKMPPQARAHFEQMLQELEFQALDEHHARTSGMTRKNRAGAEEDMMRSFLANARAQSNFLAQLEYGKEANTQFYAMQREASKDGYAGQDEFNLLAKHYAASFDTRETPIQNRITAMTTAFQLATSLGYHITNALQGVMVTVPKLAADFNDYTGAMDQLHNGYKTWLAAGGLKGKFDLDSVKDAGLRAALQHAADMGVLDVGMTEDLSQFEAFRTGYKGIDAASGKMSKLMHKLNQVSRYVETANRVSAATAAYKMAMAKHGDQAKAQEYAASILQTTQGDFSATGSPLIFKRLPKFVMQYKKYQFMMASLYANAFKQMFHGVDILGRSKDNSEEAKAIRAVGRRFLAYKLATTGVAAGFLGLPMMNVAALVFGMTGDDDEPKDLERSLRDWIGDDGLADLILRGPLNAIGLDMSAKLGDDKIFSIAPYTDIDFSSGASAAKTLVGIGGGPAATQIMRMATGVEYLSKGDMQKGFENLVPSGLANASKALRIANEGFTLKNGTVMYSPDEISGLTLMFDAIGLKSSQMKHMEWVRGQQYEIGKFVSDRTKELKANYVQAYRDGDTDELSKLSEHWLKLQEVKRDLRPMFNDSMEELKTRPLSDLLRSPASALKRDLKAQKASW